MAQTVGYGLAAGGPLAAGALHDATGGWDAPLVVLLVLLVPMTLAGGRAGRDRALEDESRAGGGPAAV
jgi:CP family cyanate transporter-like MFS transporter